MRHRLLNVFVGIIAGVCLASALLYFAPKSGLWPTKEEREALDYLREVSKTVNAHYVNADKADYKKLTRAALHGMVESLDPHSEFLEAKDYAQLEEDISSEFGGIGIQVELRKGKVVVVTPIAGTPSDRAGIRRADELVKIDGDSLEKPTLDTVVDKLRGKPGTAVRLALFRPAEKKDFEVNLVREMIKTESVQNVKVLPGNIGYLQITQFSERTGEEVINALNKLAELKATSLLIDLRNNPGGLLDGAVAVAEPFFPRGELIVYTQGRLPKDREEYRSELEDKPLDIPTAVLVNVNSASAAEIVAGALKDTGRAVIVGERSFGKGSVQSILPLRNGEGMRLTTARYYTPSGRTIHEKGVTPHVEVVLTADEDESVQLQLARPDITDPKEFKERFDLDLKEDRQLKVAKELLAGLVALSSHRVAATPAK